MPLDITADAATVAIVAHGAEPVTGDFFAAQWVTDAPTGGPSSMDLLSKEYRYIKVNASTGADSDSAWIQILIGAGGAYTPTAVGLYDVYVRIADSPEVPVLRAGSIYFS